MYHISIISTDIQLLISLKQKIKDSIYSIGVIGHLESEFYSYIEQNPEYHHLVFAKPVNGTMYKLCPTKLKVQGKVDLIMIVNHLPKEFLPFIIKCLCIGVISRDDAETLKINDLVYNIQSHGRLVNHLITQKDWDNAPNYVRPRPMPPLSNREKEVLEYLCHGYDGKSIAITIHTSVSNVRNIVASLKSKLNCQSEKELMIVSLANLWVVFNPIYIHKKDVNSINPKSKNTF